MAKTPEGIVKDQIKADCKALGIIPTMPMGTGYGQSGVSDFILNWQGRFCAIEVKAGAADPTALQLSYLKGQWEAGAIVGCVGTGPKPEFCQLGWVAMKGVVSTDLKYDGMDIIGVNNTFQMKPENYALWVLLGSLGVAIHAADTARVRRF